MKPSSLPRGYNPSSLTESTRGYYRSTWGFDPVNDLKELTEYRDGDQEPYEDVCPEREGHRGYEACLSLENDPALKHEDVQVVARVEIDGNGTSHNRIGFRGRDQYALIEYVSLVQSTVGRPAILPPWEQFAALKSFAAGLVDQGVMSTLFGSPAGSIPMEDSRDGNWATPERGESGYTRLANVLFDIAPGVVEPQMIKRVGGIIEQAPEDWIRTHVEPLFSRYMVYLLFVNDTYLASVDNATLKKLLTLFLCAYQVSQEQDFPFLLWDARVFFHYMGERNIMEELDLDTIVLFLKAMNDLLGRSDVTWGKIFRKWLTREDPRLFYPPILGNLLGHMSDPEDVPSTLPKNDYDEGISENFLSQLLETVFRISPRSGYMPYIFFQQFLTKGRHPELMKKFLILAPYAWLKQYWYVLKSKHAIGEILDGFAAEGAVDPDLKEKIDTLRRGRWRRDPRRTRKNPATNRRK